MNRRRLLAMLPLAPVAALMPVETVETVDVTPVFKRSDYCIVRTKDYSSAETCPLGHLHGRYTYDCHTIAFPVASWGGYSEWARPVTDSSVPYAILATGCLKDCPTEDGDNWHPHTHDGLFRWAD